MSRRTFCAPAIETRDELGMASCLRDFLWVAADTADFDAHVSLAYPGTRIDRSILRDGGSIRPAASTPDRCIGNASSRKYRVVLDDDDGDFVASDVRLRENVSVDCARMNVLGITSRLTATKPRWRAPRRGRDREMTRAFRPLPVLLEEWKGARVNACPPFRRGAKGGVKAYRAERRSAQRLEKVTGFIRLRPQSVHPGHVRPPWLDPWMH